jgi:hypothetical protein
MLREERSVVRSLVATAVAAAIEATSSPAARVTHLEGLEILLIPGIVTNQL